ncbi:hypothetical protein [Marinoscillum sp.]|uniref:hypothetical protein n=1 Tax=Marinoscillum sp. TaxID=2024838 RepID=UPI003BAD00E1
MNYITKGLLLVSMLATSLMMSCGEDEPTEPEELIPAIDGVYVFGTNTVAETALEPSAKMSLAVLNPDKSGGVASVDGYFGKLLYIGANSTIEISHVEGDVSTTYGADGGGTVTNGLELDFTDIDADIIHGTLVPDAEPISVSEEGLYKLFVDINTESFRMMKIEANVIGDATPGQWTESTFIPLKDANVSGATFEATDLGLYGASGYKIRFNQGYELYNDGVIATIDYLGVEDYQAAWDAGANGYDLVYKDVNLPNHETGLFTYTLSFNASTLEWDENKEKTGALENDYSTVEIGWFGNAYKIDGEEPTGQWETVHMVKTPGRDGNLYNWTWTVELIADRAFVLRDPDGTIWITYGGAAKVGSAFDDELIIKEDGQDNYWVNTAGTYDVTFTINAEDDGRTLTIEPSEGADDMSSKEYGMFGNAYYVDGTTEGAWDAIHFAKTPEMDGDFYTWSWELELIESRSFVIRESPDGEWVTYGGANKTGSAFDNEQIIKEDGQDNYYVAVGGNYVLTFKISSVDEGRTLVIEPAQ